MNEQTFAKGLVDRITACIPGVYVEYRIENPVHSAIPLAQAPFPMLIIQLCQRNTSKNARHEWQREWVETIYGREQPVTFEQVGVSIPLYPRDIYDDGNAQRYRAYLVHKIVWSWCEGRMKTVGLLDAADPSPHPASGDAKE